MHSREPSSLFLFGEGQTSRKRRPNTMKTKVKGMGGILYVDNSLFCAKDVEFYKKKLRFDCGLFLAICMHIV